MMFRRLKDSNSKIQKIKVLISNMRKVNFFWESVMMEYSSREKEYEKSMK